MRKMVSARLNLFGVFLNLKSVLMKRETNSWEVNDALLPSLSRFRLDNTYYCFPPWKYRCVPIAVWSLVHMHYRYESWVVTSFKQCQPSKADSSFSLWERKRKWCPSRLSGLDNFQLEYLIWFLLLDFSRLESGSVFGFRNRYCSPCSWVKLGAEAD